MSKLGLHLIRVKPGHKCQSWEFDISSAVVKTFLVIFTLGLIHLWPFFFFFFAFCSGRTFKIPRSNRQLFRNAKEFK